MTALLLSVAGVLVAFMVLDVLLLWSVLRPESRAGQFFVDRPDHVPEWLHRSDPRRVKAEAAAVAYAHRRQQ